MLEVSIQDDAVIIESHRYTPEQAQEFVSQLATAIRNAKAARDWKVGDVVAFTGISGEIGIIDEIKGTTAYIRFYMPGANYYFRHSRDVIPYPTDKLMKLGHIEWPP